MWYFAANARVLSMSRAAIASTVTSSTMRAGLIRAAGAMRAAPSTPIRSASTPAYLHGDERDGGGGCDPADAGRGRGGRTGDLPGRVGHRRGELRDRGAG